MLEETDRVIDLLDADERWWSDFDYRLDSSVLGRGYAREVARPAMGAAADVDPARPVLAYLLDTNLASRRTAEKPGLSLVWRGPDAGNADATRSGWSTSIASPTMRCGPRWPSASPPTRRLRLRRVAPRCDGWDW